MQAFPPEIYTGIKQLRKSSFYENAFIGDFIEGSDLSVAMISNSSIDLYELSTNDDKPIFILRKSHTLFSRIVAIAKIDQHHLVILGSSGVLNIFKVSDTELNVVQKVNLDLEDRQLSLKIHVDKNEIFIVTFCGKILNFTIDLETYNLSGPLSADLQKSIVDAKLTNDGLMLICKENKIMSHSIVSLETVNKIDSMMKISSDSLILPPTAHKIILRENDYFVGVSNGIYGPVSLEKNQSNSSFYESMKLTTDYSKQEDYDAMAAINDAICTDSFAKLRSHLGAGEFNFVYADRFIIISDKGDIYNMDFNYMFTIKSPISAVHFDSDDEEEDPYNYLFMTYQNEHMFIHCSPNFLSDIDLHAQAGEGSKYKSEEISLIATITGSLPIIGVDHFDETSQFLIRAAGQNPEVQLTSGELAVQKAVLPIVGETIFSCDYVDQNQNKIPLVIVKLLADDPSSLLNGNLAVYTVIDSLFQLVEPETYNLELSNPTLLVASYPGSLIQVTTREVRLITANQQTEVWDVETLPSIVAARMSGSHLLLSLDNGALVYFNIARYVYTTLGTPVIHEPNVAAVTEYMSIISSFRARTCHLAIVNQLNLLEIMNVSETLFSPMYSIHLGERKCTSIAWLDSHRLIVAFDDMSLTVYMVDNALAVKEGATKSLNIPQSDFKIFTDPENLSLYVSTDQRLMEGTVEEDEISLQWLALPHLDCVCTCSRDFIGLPRIGISKSGLVFFEVDHTRWQISTLNTRYTPVASFTINKKPSHPDFSYQLFGVLERENNCLNWSKTKAMVGSDVEEFIQLFGKIHSNETCSCLRIVKCKVNSDLELELNKATIFSAPKGSVITAACEFKHKTIENPLIAIATYDGEKSNIYLYQIKIKIENVQTVDEDGDTQESLDISSCEQIYLTGIEVDGIINSLNCINGLLCTFSTSYSSYALLQKGASFNLVKTASQDLSINVFSADVYKSPTSNINNNYLLLNSDRGAMRCVLNKNLSTQSIQPLHLQACDMFNRHQSSLLPISDTQIALTSLYGNFIILDLSDIDSHLIRTNRHRTHANLLTSAAAWLPDLPVAISLHRLIPGQERSIVIHGQSGAVYILDSLTQEEYKVLGMLEDILSQDSHIQELYALGGSVNEFMSRNVPRKAILSLDFIKLWSSLDDITREKYRLILPVDYTTNQLQGIVRRCCMK